MTAQRRILLLVGDIVALVGAFAGMLLIRFGGKIDPETLSLHRDSFIILSIIWLIILYIYNLYDAHFIKTTLRSFRNRFLALVTFLGIGLTSPRISEVASVLISHMS